MQPWLKQAAKRTVHSRARKRNTVTAVSPAHPACGVTTTLWVMEIGRGGILQTSNMGIRLSPGDIELAIRRDGSSSLLTSQVYRFGSSAVR